MFLPKLKFLEYERMVPLFQKRPVQPKICFNNVTKYQFVEFDTETTPLGKDAEICQIAAITKGGNTYNNYILLLLLVYYQSTTSATMHPE